MYGLLWPNQWSNPEQLGPARVLFTHGAVHANSACAVMFTWQLEIELLVRDKIRLDCYSLNSRD
jgi:hypothetical protein